jgi:hypothetical protein
MTRLFVLRVADASSLVELLQDKEWNEGHPDLRRLRTQLAQVVTVGAGLLIAWRAFGPAAPPPTRTDVVAIRESASSSSLAGAILGRCTDAGFRAAARRPRPRW